ncbi:MAG: protein translocase subunit SecD [Acidimicrobiales bacterium]|nr:protein translocase subunit SecD [Acidimicrobiales bacterium]
MKSHLFRAAALFLAALVAFIATLVSGNQPLLGLDLQGGVSVVYQPKSDNVTDEALDEATDIIRNRVDALGVAEPEISRQGSTIVVDLPGVEQQQRALELVGQTAELRFRPVLASVGVASPFPISEDCPQELTIPEDDDPAATVLLPSIDGELLCLGPTLLTGNALETASASIAGGLLTGGGNAWQVNPTFREGPDGIDLFNEAAVLCNTQTIECPTARLAIVLDGLVQSAPTINVPFFNRDQIQITGNFEAEEAQDLATTLRFGALPVELEAQQTRTISASIGTDVLSSGVTAGIIGLVLVAIFLLSYYRLSGLVAIVGLLISAMLLWSIISLLGEAFGLALSLSGIVGLIVAIGVSADSNIVYFENVKDAVASGKRVITSVERAYRNSISTIIKADVVSLIAAVLLYVLTVGAVKGFALYLGIATILDLIIAMLFMRPMLLWLAQTDAAQTNPRILGLPDNAVTAAMLRKQGGKKKSSGSGNQSESNKKAKK